MINNYWHFLSLINNLLSQELLESFSLNLHRIEKDVARCDRTLDYFSRQENLERLRNIVTTYVWDHLDIGYMQVLLTTKYMVSRLMMLFNIYFTRECVISWLHSWW